MGISISKSEITLNITQEQTIVVSPNASGYIFTSENQYIASATKEGKVTGVTVGTTFITVSNSA